MIIRTVKRHIWFGAVFVVAKAAVYFVPLLLADVLNTTDYGILEYALAGLGMLINTLLNLGVPGAYPYFIIKKEDKSVQAGFLFHPIVLTIPFIVNQLAYWFWGLDMVLYMSFNVSYIISNQMFYSTQLKSHEKSSLAVVLDSGIYLVLFGFIASFWMGYMPENIETINYFIICYALTYVFLAVVRFLNSNNKGFISAYRKILRFSIHILLSTFLIFLITTSGRIIVEYFFTFNEVGIYAFYFRLAAIVVMIHQVINIAFFKKIYTSQPKVLDKYFHLFFVGISILSLLIYFVAPFIVDTLSQFFKDTYNTYKGVYFLLSCQMVMWIATALNSNVIDRENLARKNNGLFLVLIVCFTLPLLFFSNYISFANLVYAHFTCIFFAAQIQYYTLRKKDIKFSKSSLSLALVFLIESAYYFIVF
ncbi:oligosaccharide flippase family protein [Winogradskyella sp. DF17]|uniref:Oligosaccharide flippase family protein n=1 Tax=Winogradskyella pelagia TaxID=2819984 RepID=A0ABS3SXJ9_9FLAO|nr:oligosaccharide flippase family protein [Winogradskyella sp. DF17]MBO3115220.1 oligosaccharide flippase family protein [Winogradskyella sp. DF17]